METLNTMDVRHKFDIIDKDSDHKIIYVDCSKYNNRKGTSISVCAMGKRIEPYYLFDSRIEQAKEVLENIKDYFKNDIEEIQEWEFDSYEYSDQDFESEIYMTFFTVHLKTILKVFR